MIDILSCCAYAKIAQPSFCGTLAQLGSAPAAALLHIADILLGPVMLRMQAAAVAEVASIWNCKGSIAKTLLMHYMWDKDKLMSEWHTWVHATTSAQLHDLDI
jgi:hypothetical protein